MSKCNECEEQEEDFDMFILDGKKYYTYFTWRDYMGKLYNIDEEEV